ncbi:MAG TPA: Gfo/Idh/MocA family oxidoreductase [Candidatus Hydrogenedentes bacterium]|nr:Gfo/Idh/MocA family oxidoreductase [Candidatus Hydrogenedentota bacterium]
MSHSPIRTGVVGVGYLGYHHARLYAEHDGAELVGICDTRADHGSTVAGEFGSTYYSTVQELIDAGIQAASVAVPTTGHFEVVQQLLEAGIDVLVEKPIATTLDEARDMVALANEKGCLLQVGHVERFNGAVMALTKAIKKPRFIECHRMSPFPNRGDDVSVVLDLMIHDIDVIMALDNSEIVSIDAVGLPVLSKEEDIANVRLRFASGCVANLTASRISLERMRKIRIFEENAYVSTDYSEQQVMIYRKKAGGLPDDASPMEAITMVPLEIEKVEPLKIEITSFLECVETRSKPIVSGDAGLKALQLAHDIMEFIRTHS